MAQLYPKELNYNFTASTSSSERMIYDKSKELSDSFYIFHDITWDAPDIEDSITKGQLDYIIAHPEYGFIVVEVKGGRCSYRAEHRLWETEDKQSIISEIRDPFEQAKTASRVIFKLLQQQKYLKEMFIPHDYAVVFPDSVFDKVDLRADIPKWRILDQSNLFDFRKSVEELFNHTFTEKISKADGLNIIKGLENIYGNKDLKGKTSRKLIIKDSFSKLIHLTKEQLSLLQILRKQKNVLIQGCAGSGKTMFAIHKAKMLADEGKSVLLVCFNRALRGFLEAKCEGYENITTGPFIDLCEEWLEAINCETKKEDPSEWYDNILPNLMVENIDRIAKNFDAIIVDEGQDFGFQYWVILEFLFKDYDNREFYIFADDYQNIYRGSGEFPIKSEPILLEQNLRNTNQIFDEIKGICSIDNAIEASGVDGLPVKHIAYNDAADMLDKIETILGELVSEGITMSDIVILGTKSQKNTSLKHGSKIGPFTLVKDIKGKNELRSMTTHAFKGLESPVVILAEIESKLVRFNEIIYIGMSRAVSLLYILAENSAYDQMKESKQ